MAKQLELPMRIQKEPGMDRKQARGIVEIFAGFYPRATEEVNILYKCNDEDLINWLRIGSFRYKRYVGYVKKYAKAHNIH